jgi:hypothetical protein
MYAPYGLNDDDYHSRKRSPSIDTEFRGKIFPCFALLCFFFLLLCGIIDDFYSLIRTTLA